MDLTDPKMAGFVSLEQFQAQDADRSSWALTPQGKHRESLAVFPVSLDFGEIPQDLSSQPRIILVTNTGYGNVEIQDIVVVGDFALSSPTAYTLVPGQVIQLQVTFTPQRIGTATGGLFLKTDADGAKGFVLLAGIGIVNSGAISPDALANYIITVGDNHYLKITDYPDTDLVELFEQGLI